MTIMTCDIVSVPSQTLAELPAPLLSPALKALAADGYVLTQHAGKRVLYKLQRPTFDGVLTAAAEPQSSAPKKNGRRPTPRPGSQVLCALTPEQAKAIRLGLKRRRRRLKLTLMACSKQLGINDRTYSNWEVRPMQTVTAGLAAALKKAGLSNLIPKGGN